MHFRQFSLNEKTPSQSGGRVPSLDQTGQADYFKAMPTSAWGPQPRHHVSPLPLPRQTLDPSRCTHQGANPPAQGARTSWGETKGQSQPPSTKWGHNSISCLQKNVYINKTRACPACPKDGRTDCSWRSRWKASCWGEVSWQASEWARLQFYLKGLIWLPSISNHPLK